MHETEGDVGETFFLRSAPSFPNFCPARCARVSIYDETRPTGKNAAVMKNLIHAGGGSFARPEGEDCACRSIQ